MKRYLIISTTVLALLLGHLLYPAPPTAAQAGDDTALTFLLAQQNADGSWGRSSGALNGDFITTAVVVDALSAQAAAVDAIAQAQTWLATQPIRTTSFLAARLATGVRNGADVTADLSELRNRQNADGGWGALASYATNVLDTALAVQALAAAGEDNVLPALAVLAAFQNPDGGWGLRRGDESDIFHTAQALVAIGGYHSQYELNTTRNRAIVFLHSEQNSDHGYGKPASTPFETALVLRAIYASGVPLTSVETKAATYIAGQQRENGSWADDPYSTALAFWALHYPLDSDGDGMSDACETTHMLNPADPGDAELDLDGDRLLNLEECRRGTDPHRVDSDDDSVDDGVEIQCGSDPLNPAVRNRPPQIASTPPTVSAVGKDYRYTVQADDPDGDAFSINLASGPQGMQLEDSTRLTWIPSATQVGEHVIVVTVSDGRCAGLQQYRLNVLPQGIDLAVGSVETGSVTTDPASLIASGRVEVTIHNVGAVDFNGAFTVLLFEDRDGDGTYATGVDALLGSTMFNGAIIAAESVLQTILLSGEVRFRDNLIHAWVDSDEEIGEVDETNNIGHSGEQSRYQPTGDWQPLVEWQYDHPTLTYPYHVPAVAPLIDTDGDGDVDELDVPAVILLASPATGTTNQLIALRGDSGEVIFDENMPVRMRPEFTPTVGDLDGDGRPEILVGQFNNYTLYAFNNDGTLKWQSGSLGNYNPVPGPTLADLDGDGRSEIIWETFVLNADGSLRWQDPFYPQSPQYRGGGVWYGSRQVADLDLDGTPEIIAGPSALDSDGNVLWWWQSFNPVDGAYSIVGHLDSGATTVEMTSTGFLSDGWTAIVDLDDDPYPEIVLVQWNSGIGPAGTVNDAIWIFEHDGRIHAGPYPLAQGIFNQVAYTLSAPTVADFDGDGQPEIAVARSRNTYGLATSFDDTDRDFLAIYEIDGTLIWERALSPGYNNAHSPTTATAYDFEGDGATELVFYDTHRLYIFDGISGATRYELGVTHINHFPNMYPVVADVDNDGGAEIVLTTHQSYVGGAPQRAGTLVIGDANDNWRHARRIWNQWNYHVTNVDEDASIPSITRNNWSIYNNHREQVGLDGVPSWATPDLSVSRVAFNTQNCPAGVGISARIGNGGSLQAPSGLPVYFYNGNPDNGGLLVGTASTTRVLAPGGFEDVTLAWEPPSAGPIYATVNPTPTTTLVVTDNLTLLPHTWAEASGLCNGGCAVPVNFNVFNGIDGNPATTWIGYPVDREVDPRPAFYQVHFPFAVNANAVTIINNASRDGFLGEGTLTFSNGYSTAIELDAGGEGSVAFPEQTNITWLRLTATETGVDGPGLAEFIVGGSYAAPAMLLREGTDRLYNNLAASTFVGDPCDPSANHPPTITSAPPLTVEAGQVYSYTVQASDPDGDTLTYSLATAPAGMTIDTDSGLVTWTTQVGGDVPITIGASDGLGGIAHQRFTLMVTPANKVPTITSMPSLTATVGRLYTYDVTATDEDGDPVSLSLLQGPHSADFDPVNARLAWTPTSMQGGPQSFVLRADDGHGGQAIQPFVVVVGPLPDPLPAPPIDADGDGFTVDADCGDDNTSVNPAQTEIPENGLDDDCNPVTPDVIPATALDCDVVSLKRSFAADRPVQLRTTVRTVGAQSVLAGGLQQVEIYDVGSEVVFSDTQEVDMLWPKGLRRHIVRLPTDELGPGVYTAWLSIHFAETSQCEATTLFTVEGDLHMIHLPIIVAGGFGKPEAPKTTTELFLPGLRGR